ncbi:MAG: hypothetical protein GX310_04835, partial [Synergistaceae bacterium]|nr:hypothetical protein [Synergistaceae bacterium]
MVKTPFPIRLFPPIIYHVSAIQGRRILISRSWCKIEFKFYRCAGPLPGGLIGAFYYYSGNLLYRGVFLNRSCGVLLPLLSLPGEGGTGDLGKPAREFLEFLALSGQSIWQVLPLTVTDAALGNSPYS